MMATKSYQLWVWTLVVLLLVLSGCRSEPEVTIKRFGPVQPGGTVEVKNGIAIAVDVNNPDNIPLVYRWTASRGEVRFASNEAPAGIYEAEDMPGVETVTVEIFSGDRVVAQQTIQIEVVAAAIAVQPPPPPTPTDTPTPPPDTPTPSPTNTSTPEPTEAPVTNTPTPADTPVLTSTQIVASPANCTIQPAALPPLPASETVLPALRTDQPPTIDGCLDDEIWTKAQPMTYAIHPPANDATTMTVWLAWDEKYLYAAFDVNDTQVEESFIPDDVYDGDSVGVIIENGGRIQEYRVTMRGEAGNKQELNLDRAGTTNSQAILKVTTTLNNPEDQDEGYTVEMRILWDNPVPTEGSIIPADLWSLDHDYNPGKWWDDPATEFGKISWDGDFNVTTAEKSILLADACFNAKITSPTGADDKNTAAGFPVTNIITISWEPPECVMIVQSYQNNELKNDYRPVTSGTDITIGDPGSGETEIKIWSEGFTESSDSIWVWIDSSTSPPQDIIELNPADFERQGAQFIFFTNFERELPLPVQDGIDLTDYDLEFTFRGANGRQTHLFYKSGQDYANVVSTGFTITSNQSIHFNPFVDEREQSDEGFDFAHIWAIGARITGGIGDVELTSARLIKR